MGDDKKKGGGFLKKLVFAVLFIAVVPWVGYFAYAKTTHKEPACLYTLIWNKCCK
jgi:hypothetical protein